MHELWLSEEPVILVPESRVNSYMGADSSLLGWSV